MPFSLSHAVAGFALIATAQPQKPCPTFGPGDPFPWETGDLVDGDQWAWVVLDLNARGRVEACRISETNIRSKDRRFYICNSFKKSWHTDPVIEGGKPVEATIRRYFILRGGRYEKVQKEARAKFFRDNPGERPECYSQYRR